MVHTRRSYSFDLVLQTPVIWQRFRKARKTHDVAFIVKLIEKFIADGSADPKRIYVTGVSNGGAMAMTLVCARSDLFAAAASVIINLTDDLANACHPSRPVPMPEGPIERHSRRSALLQMIGVAAVGATTRNLDMTSTAALVTTPKATRTALSSSIEPHGIRSLPPYRQWR